MMRSVWHRLALLGVGLATAQCRTIDVYAVTQDYPNEAGPNETASDPTTRESSEIGTSESGGSGMGTGSPDSSMSTTSTADSTGASTSSPISTCPEAQLTPGDTSITIDVGSLTRSYVLHVPETYDANTKAPIIIDFHGAGGTGWDQLMTSPYPEVTDPEGVVMVFPDGVNGPIGNAWNIGPCCVPGVDDLAFVDALLSDLEQRVCVDTTRVYAVGVLTGGGLVHHLACERSERFAAVSPAAFDLVEETVDDCVPEQPISVVAFRGTDDAKVPYEGGSSSLVPNMPVTFLGALGSFERWAAINGCVGEPSGVDADGCTAYTQCEGGVEVVLCTEEGGREEPGVATVAWPMLKRHVRSP